MTTPSSDSRLQDPTATLELLRINLLQRLRENEDHQACLSFLVNEEHALAKPVRTGFDTGLVVQVLRPTRFEVLVCVGKLAGGEGLTSAGFHYDAHSASSPSTEPTSPTISRGQRAATPDAQDSAQSPDPLGQRRRILFSTYHEAGWNTTVSPSSQPYLPACVVCRVPSISQASSSILIGRGMTLTSSWRSPSCATVSERTGTPILSRFPLSAARLSSQRLWARSGGIRSRSTPSIRSSGRLARGAPTILIS